jgi:serine/threonine-protein kinase
MTLKLIEAELPVRFKQHKLIMGFKKLQCLIFPGTHPPDRPLRLPATIEKAGVRRNRSTMVTTSTDLSRDRSEKETSLGYSEPVNALNAVLTKQILVLPDDTIPLPLGSGIISSVLGEGGAAVVYEIWNEKLGISRAVKVLKPNTSVEAFKRFETEMRITAQLRHPNIIEIHNVGEWHGLPYIEMEKIDGFSLDTVIHERGTLPLKVCTSIGILVCRALRFTHHQTYYINGTRHVGILHRDLKPGNIMLSKTGSVKLMDFGIATPVGISLHTMEGTLVGSMQYMAPELLEGMDNASVRSDIFSLGCVLYEMLTGQRPFAEKNMARLVAARMKNTYRPLSGFRMSCPRRLAKLIGTCLCLKPEKRIASVDEILARLEKIHAKLTGIKPEDLVENYIHTSLEKNTVTIKRVPPRKTAAAACCAGALIAGACLFWFQARPAAVQTMATRPVKLTAPPPAGNAVVLPAAGAASLPRAPEQPAGGDFGPKPLPSLKSPVTYAARAFGETNGSQAAEAAAGGGEGKMLIASLQNAYKTTDLLLILAGETEKGNFAAALRVFDALDEEGAATVKARLYKMRALQGLGNKEAIAAFYSRPDTPDKEYLLSKAVYLASLKRYAEAIILCDQSKEAPACIGSADSLDLTSLYVKASCLTSNFMVLATEEARNKAFDCWFEVKFLLRKTQDHPYYKLAEKNILLLSDEAR